MQDNRHDIVIIGAGLGGLMSGALLSKEGYKVCVLEKNKQIGGCLQSFGMDGKLFESAVHYIGSLGEGQTLYKIFKYLGLIDKLELTRLDIDCFDEIILVDREFSLAQNHHNFIDKLSSYFPEENNAIQGYIHELEYVCTHFPMYNMQLGNATDKMKVSLHGLQEKLNSLTNHAILKQVLTGNNLLHGGHYEHTPFYIHALIQNSYIESSWKCKAGSTQIAKLLKEIIESNGGSVFRNIDIKKMVEKEGSLQYAEDSCGERYYAKSFISNLHPQVTFSMLDSNLIRPIMIKRMKSLKNTMSSFVLNVSLKENRLRYKNHNIYFHKTNDAWNDVHENILHSPSSFGIFFTEDLQNRGYATSLSILTYLNAEATNLWNDSFHTTSNRIKRSQSYQEFKQQHIEYILDAVSQVIPNLKQAIQATDACTPLTYRDYLNCPDGAMYGIQKDVRNLAESSIATRTKIPNLYLTGQNVNLHGVLGVSITSVLNAADFVGLEYLVNKINQYQSS